MECAVVDNAEVLNVAVPSLRGLAPRVVTPSLNVTLPDALEGETVAVNVTDCPDVDGFCDEVSVVLVATSPSRTLKFEFL